MSNLQKSKRFDLIDKFNDISRYLDDIFTIDNPEFVEHIPDIYQGRRKHFQIEGAPKCKPQIESRSRNLITKWKYKLEDILKLTPPPC